jgi:hypothetical protein
MDTGMLGEQERGVDENLYDRDKQLEARLKSLRWECQGTRISSESAFAGSLSVNTIRFLAGSDDYINDSYK